MDVATQHCHLVAREAVCNMSPQGRLRIQRSASVWQTSSRRQLPNRVCPWLLRLTHLTTQFPVDSTRIGLHIDREEWWFPQGHRHPILTLAAEPAKQPKFPLWQSLRCGE